MILLTMPEPVYAAVHFALTHQIISLVSFSMAYVHV